MSKIGANQYPEPRRWDLKTSSAPNIPRGSNSFLDSLRIILSSVRDHVSKDLPVRIEGSSSNNNLDECCQRLRPVGLVHEKYGVWELTDIGEIWLESCDADYLAAVLCANVKFMGEMLSVLTLPKTASELQNIANNDYFLPWKQTSEINRRTVWLRDLGLIEFHDYSMQYQITGSGKALLKQISIDTPESVSRLLNEKYEIALNVSPWAIELCQLTQSELIERKGSVGYIPGGRSEITSTVSGYIALLSKPTSIETIERYSAENFGIKPSSSKSFLSTLKGIGICNQVSRTEYQATDIAQHWNENPNPVDLACCIHANCLFVFEILKELSTGEKDISSLTAASVVSYGLENENSSAILERLHLLKNAELVKDYGMREYSITSSGLELLQKITVQSLPDSKTSEDFSVETVTIQHDALLTELRLASRDSSNPDRFEQTVAGAFRALGFKAEWIGGPGKTDVLVSAYAAAKYSYRVTVDAKSTASGLVNETQLNFDTLIDHRKLHEAQYTAVVGCGFQGERIVERAYKHGIVLIDVDALCELIKWHSQVPLSSQDYRALFEAAGSVNLQVLEKRRNSILRSGTLLHAVIDCLASESEDEATGGALSVRDIYLLLKSSSNLPIPTFEEITNMLEFLASPMINCVGKNRDTYHAIGSLNEAAKKFEFFSQACSSNISRNCPQKAERAQEGADDRSDPKGTN